MNTRSGPMTSELKDLLERLRPQLDRMLCRYRIPLQDAEDVLQEAVLALLHHWGEILDKRAWLLITVRNLCVQRIRTERVERRIQPVDPPILEALSRAEPPSQERATLRWDLERLLPGLRARERRLLLLRYAMGMSVEEVACRLGTKPNTVRKTLSRAVAHLQRLAG